MRCGKQIEQEWEADLSDFIICIHHWLNSTCFLSQTGREGWRWARLAQASNTTQAKHTELWIS